MDAKKLTGVLIAAVLTASIAATAEPGTLAFIELGLIGALYVLRRRRLTVKPSIPSLGAMRARPLVQPKGTLRPRLSDPVYCRTGSARISPPKLRPRP